MTRMEDIKLGGVRGKKGNDCVRIMMGNVGTLPERKDNNGTYKIEQLKNTIGNDTNIVMMSELNKGINTLGRGYMKTIMPDAMGNMWFSAHGLEQRDRTINEETAAGGVAIIIDHQTRAYIYEKGSDTRRLGRWTWVTLKGKDEHMVTFISTYRSGRGWATTNNQLARIREERSIKKTLDTDETAGLQDPLDLWELDMKTLIDERRQIGHVYIGGDYNSDLDDNKSRIYKFMEHNELEDLLARRYDGLPSSTYARGTKRLDGWIATKDAPFEAGGYISIADGPSDHMWGWIDIHVRDILGMRPAPIVYKAKYKATSKIPSVKIKYQELMDEHMRQHKVDKAVALLAEMTARDRTSGTVRQSTQDLLDRIATRTKRAAAYADKRCRKARYGQIPFSPKFKKAHGKIRLLKLMQNRCSTRIQERPHYRQISTLAKQIEYKGATTNRTFKDITKELRETIAEFVKDKPDRMEQRKEFTRALAAERSEVDGKPIRSHMKQIIHSEISRYRFKNIKNAVGKVFGGGLSAIEITTPNGMRRIIDKEEIEREIIKVNQEKQMAANLTPLRQAPLQELLGEQGDFTKWESIIKGEIELPENTENHVRLWMEKMKQPLQPVQEITWTDKEYFEGWKKMKEDISSAPGLSFAQIKCISEGTISGRVLSQLAMTPLVLGITPADWQEATEVLIPKKAADLRPEKLRRITQFSAQMNHNKKLIGKTMMQHAEKHGFLADEQYGSRKGKSAGLHAMNKRLVTDMMRIMKLLGIYVANDASGCYDRILFLVAYLTMRHMGMTEEVAKFVICGLMDMTYTVRTSYGTSEKKYGPDEWIDEWGCLPHGIGQGAGDAAGIWAGVSSPLFDIMRDENFGFELISAITKTYLKLAGFGFVDDTDYLELLKKNKSSDTLLATTQAGLSLWEGLLRTTGGAIDPTKSDWVWIEQKWKNGTWKFERKDDTRVLEVQGLNGNIQALKQLDIMDPRETLGVVQCATGDETGQKDALIKKITTWGSRLKAASITKREARIAVSATISSTIRYPLAASAMSKQQCKEICKVMLDAALPKTGVVRNAATAIVYAANDMGGLGFKDIHVTQLIEHVKILLDHGPTATVSGKLLKTVAEATSIERGGRGNIFLSEADKYPWVEHNWIWSTIQDLHTYKIHLQNDIKELEPWRENDVFLMDEIHLQHSDYFDTSDLRRINYVRLHLKVNTLSDVANATGDQIKIPAFNSVLLDSCSKNAYEWPNYDDLPSPTDKHLWQKALKMTFTGGMSMNLLQKYRLGRWTHVSKDYIKWWKHANGRVYSQQNGTWQEWTISLQQRTTRARGRQYRLERDTEKPLHGEMMQIDAVEIGINKIQVTSETLHSTLPAQREGAQDEVWPMRHVFGHTTAQDTFGTSISNYEGKLICDGSCKHHETSSAFLTTDIPGCGGTNIIPGRRKEQTPYRAELGGILGGIMYTNRLLKRKEISQGACELACDCKGAVDAVTAILNGTTVNSTWSSYDILILIKHQLDISTIKWTMRHVDGHMDKKKVLSELDLWEKANVRADTMAKAALQSWVDSGRPMISTTPVPGTPWTISISGDIITSNIRNEIYNSVWTPQIKRHWCKRMNINNENSNLIDWISFEKTMKSCDDNDRQFRTKHMAHISATGINMKRRREREDDICPRCGMAENNTHIYECTTIQTTDIFNKCCLEIEVIIDSKGPSGMATAIRELLKAARSQTEPNLADIRQRDIRMIAQQQWELGRHATQWGIFHHTWAEKITTEWNDGQRCAHKWLASISNKIWDLNKELWEHRNDVLHKNENAVRKADNARLDIDIANIIEEIKLIPRQFLPATDKRFFQHRTITNIHKKKYPQKRKWFRQATAILRDYMRGGTSNRAMTIKSYLLGTRRRIPERRTIQTALTLTNRNTVMTETNDQLPADNVPD